MNIFKTIQSWARSLRWRNMRYIEAQWADDDPYPTITYRGIVVWLFKDRCTAEQRASLLWAGARGTAIEAAEAACASFEGQPSSFHLRVLIPDTYTGENDG